MTRAFRFQCPCGTQIEGVGSALAKRAWQSQWHHACPPPQPQGPSGAESDTDIRTTPVKTGFQVEGG